METLFQFQAQHDVELVLERSFSGVETAPTRGNLASTTLKLTPLMDGQNLDYFVDGPEGSVGNNSSR